jgi:ParB-like chromosome segregation protein Spo0J
MRLDLGSLDLVSVDSNAIPFGSRRGPTLDPIKVRRIAESILQNGQETPIMVREDGERFVLVEGLHRLEACRSLDEATVRGFLVQARRH